ncbi:adenylosuccinate synthetase [Candidatus Woesearchaeota archaeon]|nr:adenylosuccinate synthetase [Candidatus Woesearchaeota archaeon]
MLDIVVGAQVGDEGKGRIVHNLSLQNDVVAGVRAQGGNNAGHTVMHEGRTYKLHLVPSSVVARKPGYLGRGMLVDIAVLAEDIEKNGFISRTICVDPYVHLIMPWHKELDSINETQQGIFAAGSTRRGIAPAYGAKHERFGVRLDDLMRGDERIDVYSNFFAHRIAPFVSTPVRDLVKGFKQDIEKMRSVAGILPAQVKDVSSLVEEHLQNGHHVIGEAAQGYMLDVHHADYPFVTSCGTGAAAMWEGIGLGPRKEYMGEVIGVAKVYTTKVGNGNFPSEIHDSRAEELRLKGGEYGTTTGRARRIGWFDVDMVKGSVRHSGLTQLALTKLDVLGGMDEIKMRPLEKSFQGWPVFSSEEYREQLDAGIDYVSDNNLRAYLQEIREKVGVPIGMVTFGQDSKDFISYL